MALCLNKIIINITLTLNEYYKDTLFHVFNYSCLIKLTFCLVELCSFMKTIFVNPPLWSLNMMFTLCFNELSGLSVHLQYLLTLNASHTLPDISAYPLPLASDLHHGVLHRHPSPLVVHPAAGAELWQLVVLSI